jgi:hypothetical protein
VKILGDSTQELTTLGIDKLQEELSVTAASFTLARAVARGGTTGVATRSAHVVEEKMALTLLLILLFFYTCTTATIGTHERKSSNNNNINNTTNINNTRSKRNPQNSKNKKEKGRVWPFI